MNVYIRTKKNWDATSLSSVRFPVTNFKAPFRNTIFYRLVTLHFPLFATALSHGFGYYGLLALVVYELLDYYYRTHLMLGTRRPKFTYLWFHINSLSRVPVVGGIISIFFDYTPTVFEVSLVVVVVLLAEIVLFLVSKRYPTQVLCETAVREGYVKLKMGRVMVTSPFHNWYIDDHIYPKLTLLLGLPWMLLGFLVGGPAFVQTYSSFQPIQDAYLLSSLLISLGYIMSAATVSIYISGRMYKMAEESPESFGFVAIGESTGDTVI